MKRALSLVLCLVMVLGIFNVGAVAASSSSPSSSSGPVSSMPSEEVSPYLEFMLNDDGVSYSVSSCAYDATGDIVIPATYNGLPVADISPEAFAMTQIQSVVIPEGVTTIGAYAFAFCEYLKDVVFPQSIELIDDCAFLCCESLTEINLPDKFINLGGEVFADSGYYYNKDNWVNGILYLGKYLLYADMVNDDAKVTVRKGTKYIAQFAFTFSYAKEVVFPKGLEIISDYAFYENETIEKINIPNSVQRIGKYAFTDSLLYFTETNWDGTVFYIDNALISGDRRSLLGDLVVKDGTRIFADFCFGDCSGLKNITIPNSLEIIGNAAFEGCFNLSSITIPESVNKIGGGIFNGCTILSEVVLPEGITNLDDYSYMNYELGMTAQNGFFEGCKKLEEVNIPASVTSIGENAFKGCLALENINVSAENSAYASVDGILYTKTFTELLFYPKMSQVVNYIVPETITTINNYAFSDCKNLVNITLPQGLEGIGNSAFSGCASLKEVVMSDSVGVLGANAFRDCTSLEKAILSNKLEYIYEGTFYNCSSLKEIEIPETVELIGGFAFAYSGLEAIELPDYITNIDDSTFSNCKALKSVKFPVSLAAIGDSAFLRCELLDDVIIPDTVGYVGIQAFYKTAFYNDLTNWENGALYSGKCLLATNKEIDEAYTVKDGTLLIGANAFYSNNKVKTITLPDSVLVICDFAFNWCDNLETINIGNGVIGIGENLFSASPKLSAINVSAENTEYTSVDGVLFNKSRNEIISFPAGKGTEYTIPSTVKKIGDYAFSYCNGLTSVTIPEKVTSIGDHAFSDCFSLKEIRIPDEVKFIGDSAFQYCENLEEIWLGYGVTHIGKFAFDMCNKLGYVYYNSTEEDFYNISVEDGNDMLYYADVVCNNVPKVPVLKTVKNVNGGVQLTWNKAHNAQSYRVYRKTVNGKWGLVAKGVEATKYTDKTAKSGVKYSYKVRGENYYGLSPKNDACLTIKYLARPVISSLRNTNSGIKITWNKVAGADKYQVYRFSRTTNKWKLIKTVAGTTCTDTGIKNQSGKYFSYYLKAISGEYVSGYKLTDTPGIIRLTTPDVLKATSSKQGITVEWKPVEGAYGYYVYRKTNGNWKRLGKVSSAKAYKYIDKTATKGVTYTYTVKAYNGDDTSAYEAGVKCKDKY